MTCAYADSPPAWSTEPKASTIPTTGAHSSSAVPVSLPWSFPQSLPTSPRGPLCDRSRSTSRQPFWKTCRSFAAGSPGPPAAKDTRIPWSCRQRARRTGRPGVAPGTARTVSPSANTQGSGTHRNGRRSADRGSGPTPLPPAPVEHSSVMAHYRVCANLARAILVTGRPEWLARAAPAPPRVEPGGGHVMRAGHGSRGSTASRAAMAWRSQARPASTRTPTAAGGLPPSARSAPS